MRWPWPGLPGVQPSWPTSCAGQNTAACSFAVAKVSLEFSARAAAGFLTDRIVPAFRAAGWRLQRVMPDQGSEYRAAFDKACLEQGIRHTRTRPRHAWTNGFVEPLQGTILSELWRVEFRRRLFTNAPSMQAALDRYLAFYDHRHSHQGYRTRGRTPGEILLSREGKRDKRRRFQSVNTHPA